MKVTVCIGSSCHLKGSRKVVETFQTLIEKNGLKDQVELAGTFCMGDCEHGVCVNVDDVHHSVQPDNAETFFQQEIMAKL